jgi:hypothetical protein
MLKPPEEAHLAPSRFHSVIKRNANDLFVVIFVDLVIVVVVVLVNYCRPETTDDVVAFVNLQHGLKHVNHVEQQVVEKAQISAQVHRILHLAAL